MSQTDGTMEDLIKMFENATKQINNIRTDGKITDLETIEFKNGWNAALDIVETYLESVTPEELRVVWLNFITKIRKERTEGELKK